MSDQCNCYPGGFTPDTYEGFQEHCRVHGRCGDVYDPDGRPDDPTCRLPAGHDGWHSDGVGGMWEA